MKLQILFLLILLLPACDDDLEPELSISDIELQSYPLEYKLDDFYCVNMLRWSGKCWYVPKGTIDFFGDTLETTAIRFKPQLALDNCYISGKHFVCDKSDNGYSWQTIIVPQHDIRSCN